MLMLARTAGERINFYLQGERIGSVTVGKITETGKRVFLGFDFDGSVEIVREELDREPPCESRLFETTNQPAA